MYPKHEVLLRIGDDEDYAAVDASEVSIVEPYDTVRCILHFRGSNYQFFVRHTAVEARKLLKDVPPRKVTP